MSEDIKNIKRALKSGEYDGADLMKAWCALENQDRRIKELEEALQYLVETSELVTARSSEKAVKEGVALQGSPKYYRTTLSGMHKAKELLK